MRDEKASQCDNKEWLEWCEFTPHQRKFLKRERARYARRFNRERISEELAILEEEQHAIRCEHFSMIDENYLDYCWYDDHNGYEDWREYQNTQRVQFGFDDFDDFDLEFEQSNWKYDIHKDEVESFKDNPDYPDDAIRHGLEDVCQECGFIYTHTLGLTHHWMRIYNHTYADLYARTPRPVQPQLCHDCLEN